VIALTAGALLDESLRLASLGYRVFPLRPGTKTPWQGSRGVHDATTDEAVIERWWTSVPKSNIGLACGDGMFVLDIDKAAIDDDPDRVGSYEIMLEGFPKSQTQSGGFHFFVRSPDGVDIANSAGKLGVGLDVRASGGYVVAPPSRGPQGGYQWLDRLSVEAGQLPACPEWLADLLKNIKNPTKQGSGLGGEATVEPIAATPQTIARAKAYLASVPPAIEGQGGHAALLWASRVLVRGFRLTDDAAYDLLAGDYNARCSPPWEGADLDSDFMHKIADARRLPFAKPVGWLLDPEQASGANIDAMVENLTSANRSEDSPQPIASLPTVDSDDPRTASLRSLDGVEPERVHWLWPGRIPLGKLSIIAGLPGLGKSVLTLDLAARMSTGADWPDGAKGMRRPAGVVLVSAEDDVADTIVPRLKAAGADLSRISALDGYRVKGDDVVRPVGFENTNIFAQAIARTPNCRLIIIDPVGSFVGGKADSYKDSDVRGLLAPLAKMAADMGVAVLLVAHLNKTSGGAAIHRVAGAGAWSAATRSAWLVSQSPDDQDARLLLPLKANLSRRPTGMNFTIVDHNDSPAIAWGSGVIAESADDILGRLNDGRHNRESPAQDDAVEFLEAELLDEPKGVTTKELKRRADDAGLPWGTIRRAQKLLKIKPERCGGTGSSGEWRWALPDPVYDAEA